MATIKALKEKYIGSTLYTLTTLDGAKIETKITKCRPFEHNCVKYVVFCSDNRCDGLPYGVEVEKVIRVIDGVNVIEGRCRPADNMTDAIDVALEMIAYGNGL